MTVSTRQTDILNAALDCFSKYGVEATTIGMICDSSGASVGSVYHRYKNKEGIAAAVYIQGLQTFVRQMNSVMETCTTLKDMIYALVYANIDWISENQELAKFVFYHRSVLSGADKELEFEQKTKCTQEKWWEKIIELDQDHMLIPQAKSLCLSLVIGPTHDYAKRWLKGNTEHSLLEMREAFAEAAYKSLTK